MCAAKLNLATSPAHKNYWAHLAALRTKSHWDASLPATLLFEPPFGLVDLSQKGVGGSTTQGPTPNPVKRCILCACMCLCIYIHVWIYTYACTHIYCGMFAWNIAIYIYIQHMYTCLAGCCKLCCIRSSWSYSLYTYLHLCVIGVSCVVDRFLVKSTLLMPLVGINVQSLTQPTRRSPSPGADNQSRSLYGQFVGLWDK